MKIYFDGKYARYILITQKYQKTVLQIRKETFHCETKTLF